MKIKCIHDIKRYQNIYFLLNHSIAFIAHPSYPSWMYISETMQRRKKLLSTTIFFQQNLSHSLPRFFMINHHSISTLCASSEIPPDVFSILFCSLSSSCSCCIAFWPHNSNGCYCSGE